MRMTGSKKYSPVGTKAQPVWGSIFDQRKSQLHHFTIGFQKQGICADSLFLESNGKMVQLGFSLIKNRAPHGLGFGAHRAILFTPGHAHQLTSSGWLRWDDCSLVEPCLFGDTGIEPAELDF